MPNIFTYLDYRDYLKDAYRERREAQPFFSYRYIGNKVGMDSSYLTRLFQKKLHLGDDLVDRMAAVFELTEAPLEYFRGLVAFGKAKTEDQARVFHEQLIRLRGVEYRQVREDELEYFSSWVHAALRSLLDFRPFDGDYEALGAALRPPVSGDEAKRSVFLLERLGLVKRNGTGYEVLDTHLHSGEDWTSGAIRDYQKETMRLAAGALDSVPAAERDITTMTMDIDGPALEELRRLIREFQENVARLVGDAGPSDRVMQLNMQLFPMSQCKAPKA